MSEFQCHALKCVFDNFVHKRDKQLIDQGWVSFADSLLGDVINSAIVLFNETDN